MSKHTPGPFEASRGNGDGEDYEPERWVVTTSGAQKYLVAVIENGAPGDTMKTEEANAKLFAAAPDLLAILKKIVDGYYLGGSHSGFPVRADALAIIAKAEGTT